MVKHGATRVAGFDSRIFAARDEWLALYKKLASFKGFYAINEVEKVGSVSFLSKVGELCNYLFNATPPLPSPPAQVYRRIETEAQKTAGKVADIMCAFCEAPIAKQTIKDFFEAQVEQWKRPMPEPAPIRAPSPTHIHGIPVYDEIPNWNGYLHISKAKGEHHATRNG